MILNMSVVFIIQSYFSVRKEVRLNSALMKSPNKRDLQNITNNNSVYID